MNLGSPELAPLVDRMKLAGFDAVFLGIENPDEDALRRMNKKQNLKVDIPAAVAAIQRSGIEVYAGFIFGGDEDTPSSAQHIVDFVKSTRIFTAMAGMLTPVPHTPLYERLRQEGRLHPAEFSGNNTDDDVQFEPAAMAPADMKRGIHDILYRLFNRAESYRRALEMLTAVRPHIFGSRRIRPGDLRAAFISFWRQGVGRFDREYFSLLYRAWQLDHRIRAQARGEQRRLRRALRASGGTRLLAGISHARAEELVGLARDYLVRFRPEATLASISQRAAELRERVQAGALSASEARAICENAVRYLKVEMRRHRFPGITFTRAIEAAVKALHYQKVMDSIVGAQRRPGPAA